jgi:hypothetical protein
MKLLGRIVNMFNAYKDFKENDAVGQKNILTHYRS